MSMKITTLSDKPWRDKYRLVPIADEDPLVIRKAFINEMHALLEKYGAEITADDHWQGYAECGQDVRMTVDFSDCNIGEIDLGKFIDAKEHGGV